VLTLSGITPKDIGNALVQIAGIDSQLRFAFGRHVFAGAQSLMDSLRS
jgi:hypothetical protein